jgi:hypothetical protein
MLSYSLTQAIADAPAWCVNAAGRVGGRHGSAGGLDTTEVREWARAQGIEVKIAAGCADLVAKFNAATGQQG